MEQEVEVWLARNKNNSLYVYSEKPKKISNKWGLDWEKFFDDKCELPYNSFTNIKWKDKEPTKAKIILCK